MQLKSFFYLFLLLIILLSSLYMPSVSSNNNILWAKNTNGNIRSISITPDGENIAILDDSRFVYLLSENGNIIWSKHLDYDGGTDIFMRQYDVFITEDKEYVIAAIGTQDSIKHIYTKLYVFSIEGILLWDSDWDYAQQNRKHCAFSSIIINSDGSNISVILEKGPGGGLYTEYNVFVFSIDGRLKWNYETDNHSNCIASTPDGSSFVYGSSNTLNYVRDGSLVWTEGTKGPVYSVDISSNGKYILVGEIGVLMGGYITYTPYGGLMLISNKRDKLWRYQQGLCSGETSKISKDGTICYSEFVTCESESNCDINLYAYSNDGRYLWGHYLGHTSDYGEFISMSPNAEYILIRDSNKKVSLIKNGNIIGEPVYIETDWQCKDILVTNNGKYIIASYGNSLYSFNPYYKEEVKKSRLNIIQYLKENLLGSGFVYLVICSILLLCLVPLLVIRKKYSKKIEIEYFKQFGPINKRYKKKKCNEENSNNNSKTKFYNKKLSLNNYKSGRSFEFLTKFEKMTEKEALAVIYLTKNPNTPYEQMIEIFGEEVIMSLIDQDYLVDIDN